MPEYRAIYKCRLCGEEFEEKTVNDTLAFATITAFSCGAAESFDVLSENKIFYKSIQHHCKDGSYGFADFCGFKKVGGEDESD